MLDAGARVGGRRRRRVHRARDRRGLPPPRPRRHARRARAAGAARRSTPRWRRIVEAELRAHDVDVRTGVRRWPRSRTPARGTRSTSSSPTATRLGADVVLLGVGVRPSTALARAAGLELSPAARSSSTPAQRTSDPHIWAVGDAIEVTDVVTGAPGVVPLAGPANRQGRIAADAIWAATSQLRARSSAPRSCGSSASPPPSPARRRAGSTAAGVEHHVVHLHPGHHAGYYPGAEPIHLEACSSRPDGRLLGAQAVGARRASTSASTCSPRRSAPA